MTIVIYILIILAIILALAGIVGAILPALPGPPLCWGSMLIAYFTCSPYISGTALWLMLVMTIVAEVLDYIAPIWMAKAGGGSRAAITGSTIGLVLGFFFMPIGLLVGPLLGAFVGEMLSTREVGKAIRIALLSFLSFLLSTGFQLILSLHRHGMLYHSCNLSMGLVKTTLSSFRLPKDYHSGRSFHPRPLLHHESCYNNSQDDHSRSHIHYNNRRRC